MCADTEVLGDHSGNTVAAKSPFFSLFFSQNLEDVENILVYKL